MFTGRSAGFLFTQRVSPLRFPLSVLSAYMLFLSGEGAKL